MTNTLLEVLAAVLVVAGIFQLAGTGWALVTAGVLVGLYVEVGDYLSRRVSAADR